MAEKIIDGKSFYFVIDERYKSLIEEEHIPKYRAMGYECKVIENPNKYNKWELWVSRVK